VKSALDGSATDAGVALASLKVRMVWSEHGLAIMAGVGMRRLNAGMMPSVWHR
jgi:hypothetical protein